MTTDDERRDAALRLRDEAAHGEMHLRDFLDALCMCIKTERNAYRALLHLADLIEPGVPKVKCVAEVKVDGERLEQLAHDAVVELTGIDRDALLVEVKELEKCAYYFGLDFDEDEPLRDRLKEASEAFAESARCIREALGVDDG